MPGGFRLLIRKAFQRQHRAVGKMLVVGSLRNVSRASPCRCRPLEHDGGAILAVPVRWLTGVELLVARTRDGPRGPRSTGSFDRLFGTPSPNASKYPFCFCFFFFFAFLVAEAELVFRTICYEMESTVDLERSRALLLIVWDG